MQSQVSLIEERQRDCAQYKRRRPCDHRGSDVATAKECQQPSKGGRAKKYAPRHPPPPSLSRECSPANTLSLAQ